MKASESGATGGSLEGLPDKLAVVGKAGFEHRTAQMLNHIDPFTPPHRDDVSTQKTSTVTES